jgi:hypothetical protein
MEVQSTGPSYNTTHFKRYIVPATVGITVRYSSAHIDVTLDPCLRVSTTQAIYYGPEQASVVVTIYTYVWKVKSEVKIAVSRSEDYICSANHY